MTTTIPRDNNRQKLLYRMLVWGSALILWEIAGRGGQAYLPPFSEVLGSMIAMFTNGDLLIIATSLRQMLIGFGLAAVVGVALGVLMGSSTLLERALGLYVRALHITSLEALIPLILSLFGTKFVYQVIVVFIFALPHITLNIVLGIRSVEANLLETARAFCTPRHRLVTAIMLPAALPYIMTGLRLGLANAIKGMIIAELWVVVGTGQLLVELSARRALAELFAITLVIMLIGVMTTRGLLSLQRRIAPWWVESGT